MSRLSGVAGDIPVQLATHLPDWSAGGLLRLSVCLVVLQSPRARHALLDADKLLVASSFDSSNTPDFLNCDILAMMSRGCYD